MSERDSNGDFDNIPNELKERAQWLLWDSSADTPRRPHWRGNFGVSWTNPDDWHTFEEAVEAANERESWGIGYVFAQGNDEFSRGVYGALDLDGCVAEGSGPKDWLPGLKPFFDEGAYIEYSPSGEGVHIPIAGFEVPEWWTDVALDEHEGVEAYEKKFFTFTGDTLRGSGDEVVDDGEYVEKWLKEAYEEIRGERPWEPEDDEPTKSAQASAPTRSTGNVEEIADAIDDLDARDVADQTIVSAWNDDAGTSGDNRAFYPTWGPNSNGTANIVDRDGWTDTGTDSGSGGPLTMALIDMGEISHSGATWGDASGSLWWDAVDHLQDLGFGIPEYDSGTAVSTRDAADDSSDGGETSWSTVQAFYSEEGPLPGRVRAADALEERRSWMYVLESETLWVYDDETGYFNVWGEQTAARLLERNLGEFYSRSEKAEVVDRLKARSQIHREELNARTHADPLVCVGNGVLNIETGTLSPHSPEYAFTRGVEHEWDPDAVPERVLRFLREVTKRDADMWTLIQQLGHGLMPGHPFKAFIVMHGPGDNGKSAVGKLFRRFVGDENAASVELRDFDEDDFATGDLPGKMINIGDDLSGTKLKDVSMLKRLTGDDSLRANAKYQSTFDFENEAAMFFSGNEPPVFGEQTAALKGRLYPIHMPYRFTQEDDGHKDADPRLVEKIVQDEEEMSGLLALAVQGARQLIETGGHFAMPESPDERMRMYEAASDPIRRFVMNHLEQRGPNNVILKEDAHTVYATMCRDNGERAAHEQTFKSEVTQQAIIDVENGQTRKLKASDNPVRCWKYVGFNESARDYMSDRLEARYFGDEESADESDPDGGDGDDNTPTQRENRFNARPVMDVAQDPTGYATVTVEVLKVEKPDHDKAPAMRAVVKDETSAVDVISWDNANALTEGATVLIQNAELNEHDGKTQLTIQEHVTDVTQIQQGVGYTEGASPGAGQGQLNAQADGGMATTDEFDELRPKVISELQHAGKQLTVPTLAGRLSEERDRIEDCIDRLAKRGHIIVEDDRVTLND